LPQVETVAPQIAVCLGAPAFNAMRVSAGHRRVRNVEEGITSPFEYGDTVVWCQAHTGALGRNHRNRGGVDRVNADWERMTGEFNSD
jgi:hypothetical protein